MSQIYKMPHHVPYTKKEKKLMACFIVYIDCKMNPVVKDVKIWKPSLRTHKIWHKQTNVDTECSI